MSTQVLRLIAAKTNPPAVGIKRGISTERRMDAVADRIAARLDEISQDPTYVGYAWDMEESLRSRLDLMVLNIINQDRELRAAFRAALSERAEIEAIQGIEAELDEIEAEEIFSAFH